MSKIIGLITFLLLAAGALLTGCGSSGGSSDPNTYTVSGSVIDGAVANASCSSFQITITGHKGPKLAGPALTTSSGAYTLTTTLAVPQLIECRGGTFTDWATGATVTLNSDDILTAVGTTADGSATIAVTPLTHMAAALALRKIASGATVANGVTEANGTIAQFFGLDSLLTTMPMNPTVAGAGIGATQAQKDYAMILAGIAKYAATNSIANPLDLVDALATDASDGALNGMIDSAPVPLGGGTLSASAATSGLATAMTAFAGSTQNASFVSVSNDLMGMLNGSDGTMGDYVASISLSPTSKTLTTVGETFTIGTKAINMAGTSISPAPAFTFSSSDQGVATVDASGLVVAMANGTATITVRSMTKSATCVVTVNIPPNR